MIRHSIFILFISFKALASSDLDCADPKNVTACARITYTLSESSYNTFMESATKTIKEKTNSNYAENFLTLGNQWKKLVKLQCEHVRSYYHDGSLGSASYISCYDTMYENRLNELKMIYDDIIGDR